MRVLPRLEEEREIATDVRVRAAHRRGWLTSAERQVASGELKGIWRTARPLVRIVGFIVGAVLVATFYGFLKLLEFPAVGIVTAISAVAITEWLIIRKRFWKSGVEEVLWIGGLFAIIFDLPGPPQNEGLLLFAFASLVAAIRLLQPWFAAAFAGFVVMYMLTEFENSFVVPAAVYTIGALSALLLARTWRMPMVEGALSMVTVASLPLAYAVLNLVTRVDDTVAQIAGATGALVFAAVGIVLRHRAPLWSALLGGGCVVVHVLSELDVPAEWTFLSAGIVVVVLAQLLDRQLRHRESGVTARREPGDNVLELMQTATANQISQASSDQQTPGDRPSGGGSFGGGGASGEY